MEPFIGQITIFGFNFAPQGWAKCNGQLLQIQQNTALFSLLGTYYGGDGRSTFGLPDLQGRLPMHQGQGAGRSPRSMGQAGGQEQVTLQVPEIPSHSHSGSMEPKASDSGASTNNPSGNYPGLAGGRTGVSVYDDSTNTQMGATDYQTDSTGGGQAHDNVPPFQVVNFCIALQGIYPSRN